MPPVLGTPIELIRVGRALDLSLSLLRRTFCAADSPGTGGWYHMLDEPTPGPTATAVALDLFRTCGAHFDRYPEALAFLRGRQVSSTDSRLDGGWATNTSFNQPVMEATGWVARTLGAGRFGLVDCAPDSARALRWIVANQNKDGGWGSFHGAPSRVWLTCLALRALVVLNPHDPTIETGMQWLLDRQRHDLGAWGERDGADPTVTHTAFALLTLHECRPNMVEDRIVRGYDWLAEHVQPTVVEDREARVETYNVTANAASGPSTWQTALPHYGLPVALSALLRHPKEPPADGVTTGFDTILREQQSNGAWRNVHGASGNSIWAVAPFVQALRDLQTVSPTLPGDQMLWSSTAVVVQRENAKDEPLATLIRAQRRTAVTRFFARYWATLLLAASILLGMVFVAYADLEWKDYLLGLILPMALFAVQEVRHRADRRAAAGAQQPPRR